MTERAKMKEIANFTGHPSFLGGLYFFLLHHRKGSRRHILANFVKFCETGKTPKECFFSSKKRPKEGERVARGHFFMKEWVKALDDTRIL